MSKGISIKSVSEAVSSLFPMLRSEKKKEKLYGRRQMAAADFEGRFGQAAMKTTIPLDLSELFEDQILKRMITPEEIYRIVGKVMEEHLVYGEYYVRKGDSLFAAHMRMVGEVPRIEAIASEIDHLVGIEVSHRKVWNPHQTIEELETKFGRDVLGKMHLLDVAELLFGPNKKTKHIPRRVTGMVRSMLREFLSRNDYFVQTNTYTFNLLFTGMPSDLAEVKYSAITQEIIRRGRELILAGVSDDTTEEEDAPEKITVRAGPVGTAITERDKEEASRIAQAFESAARNNEQLGSRYRLKGLPWDIRVNYSPIWTVRNQLLTSYVCHPVDDSRKKYYQDPNSTEQYQKLQDLPMIHRAFEDVADQCRRKVSSIVVLPIHFSTINRPPFRDAFFDWCRDLTGELRRLIVLEIVGIPAGFPRINLQERIHLLKNYFRTILIRSDLSVRSLDVFHVAGIHAVGCDISEKSKSDEQAMKKIERFASLAEHSGFNAYLHGVSSPSLAVAAVVSGFKYLSGEAIGSDVEKPDGLKEYKTHMLYSQLPGSGSLDVAHYSSELFQNADGA